MQGKEMMEEREEERKGRKREGDHVLILKKMKDRRKRKGNEGSREKGRSRRRTE